MKVTDEMVKAAINAFFGVPSDVGMRRALEAALAAQTWPEMGDVESGLADTINAYDDLKEAHRKTILSDIATAHKKFDEQQLTFLAMIARLAASPDPAPDNAEFETALDVLITQAEFLGSVRDTSTRDDVEHVRAARQRILALHRQATHAGYEKLRKLREWVIEEYKEATPYENAREAFSSVEHKIDALLKEATDEVDG